MAIRDPLPMPSVDSPRPPALRAQETRLRPLEHFLMEGSALGKSAATTEWYRQALTDFERFVAREFSVPDIEPQAVTKPLVLAWLDELRRRGCGDATVNNRFRAIRAFLNWCVAERYIRKRKSPIASVPEPSFVPPLPSTFSPAYIDAMLYLCPPGVWWGDRNRAMLVTILHTGARRAEIAGLLAQDIDWKREQMRVLGKGGKERTVYLDPEARTALLSYARHRKPDQPRWFQTCRGGQMSPKLVGRTIERLAIRAGVVGIKRGPHTGRHSFAIEWLEAGGNARMLQETLGHESWQATAAYTRAVNSRMAMAEHRQLDLYGDRNGVKGQRGRGR